MTYDRGFTMRGRYPNVSAFILAGGASSRMGRDKGLLELAGVPIVVRTAHIVEPLVRSVAVVGPLEKYAHLGICAIPDADFGVPRETELRSGGALLGLATALSIGESTWNLVLSCDLPYLNREWLGWLLSRATESQALAVLPRSGTRLEPLAAVYHKQCAPSVVAAAKRGVRKLSEAVGEFKFEVLDEAEWEGSDPTGRVLSNMNSPADYEEARKWHNQRALGL